MRFIMMHTSNEKTDNTPVFLMKLNKRINKRGIFMNEKSFVRSRKKRKLRKTVVFILMPAIAIFLAVSSYSAYLYFKAGSVLSDSYEDDGRKKSDKREQQVDPKADDISVLITGIDASDTRGNKEDDSGLTDSLMVATLNKDNNNVKLLSIPRDSYVNIPGEDNPTKINEAYAYGGLNKTIETVENLLDIPIDYYLNVNFDAVIDTVDAVNGINIDVPYELYEQDSKDHTDAIHLKPGEQKLNGEEALAYTRTRKQDNDMERGDRQKEVIKSMMDRTVSMRSVLKYNDIIDAVGNNIKTNMKFDEMKKLISYGTSNDLQVDSLTMEGQDYQPGNKYFYQLDEDSIKEVQKKLKKQLDLDDTDPHIDEDVLPNVGNDQNDESYGNDQEGLDPDHDPNQDVEEQEPNNNLEQNEGEQNPDYDNDQEQNMLDPDDEVEGDIPPTEGQEEEPQDEDLGY